MKIVRKKLADLKSPDRNLRIHDENQITELCRSVTMFGQIRPIIIDENNVMLAGNGLHAAMTRLGLAEAECHIAKGLSENKKKKLMIADNRIFDLGADDMAALDAFILELKDDLDIPGFDEDILKSISFESEGGGVISRYSGNILEQADDTDRSHIQQQGNNAPPHTTEDDGYDETGYIESDGMDDAPDLPEIPMTEPGDLWCLGNHRLICGSATERVTIMRLMEGKKASCIFTDPPYGVGYISQSGKFEEIENDDMRGDSLISSLLIPAFKNLVEFSDDRAAFYIWHAAWTRRDFEDAMTAVGLIERQYLIWVKNNFQMGHADYHWGHEPCYYAHKAGQAVAFYGDRTNQTVWKAALRTSKGVETVVTGGVVISDGTGGCLYVSGKPPKNRKMRSILAKRQDSILLYSESKASTAWEVSKDISIEHPTQKPVELGIRALGNSTRAGEIVLDIFGGSGSTLIAAEQTGRVAYVAELDPKYCDLIINRYVNMKGSKGIRCVRGNREASYVVMKRAHDKELASRKHT